MAAYGLIQGKGVRDLPEDPLPLLSGALGDIRKETEAMELELRALRVAARAGGIIRRDFKALARQAANYVSQLKAVLESGTVDERKRFVRAFVHEIVVDGRKRIVHVAFYDDGLGAGGPSSLAAVEAVAGRLGDVSPQLVPRTGPGRYGERPIRLWEEIDLPQDPSPRKRGRPKQAF